MSTGILSEILFNDNGGRPVLVNFQNGTLVPDKLNQLRCELYDDEEDHFIPAVASNNTIYTGRISRKEDLYNNFILRRNKESGECKLIRIDRDLLKVHSKPKRKVQCDDTSTLKKLTDLNKYFGSKRTKMVTEQRERLKVDVENIKTTLEQTAKETKINESDIIPFKTDENDSLYRPPINRNAGRVEEIYPLNVLVPPEILQELKPSAKELLEAKEDDLKLCEFIKKEFIKLQQSPLSERITKGQILLYIDCLVNITKLPAKSISTKKFNACPYSSKVSTHILNNFTLMSATGRTRPLSMKDKCICYILVLSMLAFNNVINLEIFTKDLKLGLKKLQDISKVLAFTFRSSNKSNAFLCLPLPPPVNASSGRKRQ